MGGSDGNARRRVIELAEGQTGLNIARLYFALLRQRFTGTLEIEQETPERGARMVWFRGGMPLFTDWVSPSNVLGEILLSGGIVDQTQYHGALQAMASSGGLLGHVLVEQGHLDAKGLADALRTQCQRKLVETFALRGGSVAVDAVEHGRGRDDDLRGQVNVLSLVLQGVTQHFDDDRIREDMHQVLEGDLVATPAMPKYHAQFGFRPGDHPIVQELARGTRLANLRRPGIAESRALAVIYSLWACQMLRTGADASQAIAQGATAAAALRKVSSGAAARGASGPTTAEASPASPAPKSKSPAKKKPATPKTSSAKPKPKPQSESPSKADEGGDTGKAASDPFEAELIDLEKRVAADANPFDLFELGLDTDRKEVRARWADLSKRFHPDAVEAVGRSDLRDRTEAIFASLSEAYGILSSKEKREQLKLVIESGGTGKSNEDTAAVVRNALEAEMVARDGDKLLKRNNYARAAECYRRASELSPQDFDTKAALLWCEFQLGPRAANDVAVVLTNLELVINEQEKCARAHYYRGLAYLQMKNDRLARESLQKTLAIDPRMTEAERQLHAINVRMRQQKEEKKEETGGLSFKNLFGRKG
jgi:tetratricopeptide (TPR) repeat protein